MEDAAGAPKSAAPASGGKGNGAAGAGSIAALNQRAHKVVDKAAVAASQTADWLASSKHELSQKTNRYVTSNPLKAVGMAFVAGLLLGRLLK